MKSILFIISLFINVILQAQQIPFKPSSLQDASQYPQAIASLATNTIPFCANTDKSVYLDDLFRLHFAAQDFVNVIRTLDSLDKHFGAEKGFLRVPGFHYRMHAMAMLIMKEGKQPDYESAFAQAFTDVYSNLNLQGKEQARKYYANADISGEKENFIALAERLRSSKKDSIAYESALELVKAFNYWQVYDKTLSLANRQFKKADQEEAMIKKELQLGLLEGNPVPSNNQVFIQHVFLLDVEKKAVWKDVTVAITGNKISAVHLKGNIKIPATGTIIDGKGKYLIPGLTDAHVHFFQTGGLYTRPDGFDLRKYIPFEKEIEWSQMNMQDALRRYVQNGITTVIDVGATHNFLKLRDKYRGKTYAPNVFMTGPLITTSEPAVFQHLGDDEPFSLMKNEEEARELVRKQLPYKPDFIKIWYILDAGNKKEASAYQYLPLVKAVIEEAHKHSLKVAIHATERIAAQLAVENGCDFLVHSIDDELISDSFVALLKAKKTIVCPTLIVYDGYTKTYGQQLNFSTSELRKANPHQLGTLFDLRHLPEPLMINSYKQAVLNNKLQYQQYDSICFANLRKLANGGVRIVAGTDAGNVGTLHASSYINELKEMKLAGMDNWLILQSATIHPAYILSKENEYGSIRPGKMADCILLNANPLDSLEALTQIAYVINKGMVIVPDTLVKETPLALVQRQLNAYNAHNLEAFLEPYADDVELYGFPGTVICKGKEEMRKQYQFLNTTPTLHCEIKSRIIQGDIIIDKESVAGFGSQPIEATAIYHIEKGKIRKVYFIQ